MITSIWFQFQGHSSVRTMKQRCVFLKFVSSQAETLYDCNYSHTIMSNSRERIDVFPACAKIRFSIFLDAVLSRSLKLYQALHVDTGFGDLDPFLNLRQLHCVDLTFANNNESFICTILNVSRLRFCSSCAAFCPFAVHTSNTFFFEDKLNTPFHQLGIYVSVA